MQVRKTYNTIADLTIERQIISQHRILMCCGIINASFNNHPFRLLGFVSHRAKHPSSVARRRRELFFDSNCLQTLAFDNCWKPRCVFHFCGHPNDTADVFSNVVYVAFLTSVRQIQETKLSPNFSKNVGNDFRTVCRPYMYSTLRSPPQARFCF